MSRTGRLALVEWAAVDAPAESPLRVQAELLSLSRSSLYYQPVLPSPQEVAIKHCIDELYTAYPFYGSRRITTQLVNEGLLVNRKTVQRHMREMGIVGIAPGPNLSQRRKDHTVYPYLLREVVFQHTDPVFAMLLDHGQKLRGEIPPVKQGPLESEVMRDGAFNQIKV